MYLYKVITCIYGILCSVTDYFSLLNLVSKNTREVRKIYNYKSSSVILSQWMYRAHTVDKINTLDIRPVAIAT